MRLKLLAVCIWSVMATKAMATKIFIPMSATGQSNHLKAYGVIYAALKQQIEVDWLLNYNGGSYGMEYNQDIARLCTERNVKFTKMSATAYTEMVKKMRERNKNTTIIKLTKPPRIAVYTPASKKPWDDAVTLALTYAEIPFDKLYADEVLAGDLDRYDWLHLHHEDFTGQYGKFWGQFQHATWYIDDKKYAETLAAKNGFKKVSQMQLAVVKKIRAFVARGGNLFAMCSATDTYDIALAAEGTDICDTMFDGDKIDVNAQAKLDYSQCFAFRNFVLVTDPYRYEVSSIDNTDYRFAPPEIDSFTINTFPIAPDPVPAMLTQNHVSQVKGFMGQTTAFRNDVLKPGVEVLADFKLLREARYIHGDYGKGTWTFYGGHDPEAYRHMVNDPVTDLSLYPSSPGYRLILNNVLFPAAERVVLPTVFYPDGKTPEKPATAEETKPRTERVKIAASESNTELIISMTEKIKEVVLTNAAGKEVFRNTYDATEITLEMGNIPAGLYLVNVNGLYAGKIIKN